MGLCSLGQCPVCPDLITDCHCLGRVKPILCSSLGTGAWALLGMDAHTAQASLVNPAFLRSLRLCVCSAQLLARPVDLPLIYKLPLWFFISFILIFFTELLSSILIPLTLPLHSLFRHFLFKLFFVVVVVLRYLDQWKNNTNPTLLLSAVES